MPALADILSSSTTMSVYYIGSIALIGVNGLFAAWLAFGRETSAARRPRPTSQQKVAAALIIGFLLLLAGASAGIGSLMSHQASAAGSAAPAGVSIDEIHRTIDLKSLPAQSVSDYM